MNDFFVVVHIATTCDEQGVYVTKDSAEIIEIAWRLIDAKTLGELARDSVLIRPVNTPITTVCTSLTTLTWEHVRNAGTFKDAISKLDSFIHDRITSKGLDFTFVTLNAWDLRVQLPREARDKSVVLPPYLQHSRVFDLKQEYSRWQAHHLEALSYPASNLQNIITALEVDVEAILSTTTSAPAATTTTTATETTAPTNTVPSLPLPAFSNHITPPPMDIPGSPSSSSNVTPVSTNTSPATQARRAGDEVNLLSAILTALIKKSVPLEDHPDVLTRPFDARADVRAFLAERSKVLHLSNLPNDTTQSELESWFTQYGGRPIAFWTLKTPDQHKPTGSGFAVFASHEEASESLAMNGRALNDKSIEVQPSSARVLDRAQDILTPFPPSKNRPRPGDWTCPSCGFSNFQRRTACFRCSFPAASAAAIQESMFTGQPQGNQQAQTSNQQQQVHVATQSNNQNNNLNGHHHNHHTQNPNQNQNQNAIHQNQNGHQNGHQSGHHNGHQNNHQNNHQNHHPNNNNNNNTNSGNNTNNNNNGQNQRVSSVPFRAGDWKCGNEGCAYHNFAKNICCLRCGAPRVQQMGQQPQPQQSQQPQQHHQQQQHMTQPQQIPAQQQYYNSGMYNDEMKDLSSKMGGIALGYMKEN